MEKFINKLLSIRLFLLIKLFPFRFRNIRNMRPKEGWELTFNDEFDQGKLDRTKWITYSYDGTNFNPTSIYEKNEAPREYYADDVFEFTNDTIKQITKKEPIEVDYTDWEGLHRGKYTIPYQIAQIQSVKSFEQQYGYFEIRSKMPNSTASWPAFWLCSRYDWPPEIDIYESFPGKNKRAFETNVHWGDYINKQHPSDVAEHKVMLTVSDFHVYACEWDKDYIKFYYDNLLVRVFKNKEALACFNQPMFIIISNGVHPDYMNRSDAIFPNYHEVDYVRAYKKG